MKPWPYFGKAFAQVLRESRRDRQMSQHKLGAAIGSSQTYIRLLEGEQRTPSVTAFLSIANALGIDSRIFLGNVLRRMEQLGHAQGDSSEQA